MATGTPDEVCFILIKPDAIERGKIGEIINRIEGLYLRIHNLQQRSMTREWAENHYAEHHGKSFFKSLCDFMICMPIIGFEVHGPNAIARMRRLAGSTVDALPGTIRGDYGFGMHNLIHVSDSPESAQRESNLFYGK